MENYLVQHGSKISVSACPKTSELEPEVKVKDIVLESGKRYLITYNFTMDVTITSKFDYKLFQGAESGQYFVLTPILTIPPDPPSLIPPAFESESKIENSTSN